MINLRRQPSRRQAVAAHVGMGVVLQAVLVAQSLVILPLAVNTVGTEPYGYWLASGGILSWLTLASFGSAGLTTQRCAAAYGRQDYQSVRDWFCHGMLMAIVSAILFAALLLPASIAAPHWLGATGSLATTLSSAMVIAGLGAMLTPLNDTARGLVCALQRNGVAMGAEVTASAFAFGFTVWSLIEGWGIGGIAWGAAIRVVFALLINGIIATTYVSIAAGQTRWSWVIFKEFGRSLVPLWSSSVVMQLLPQFPLVVLAKMLGPESGPVACLAYTATMRPIILVEMLTMHGVMSTSTAISHLVEDPRAASGATSRIRTLCTVAYATIAFGVALYCLGNRGFVHLWVGPQAFLGQSFVFAAAVASCATIQVRSLINIGASIGMVTETAVFQAVEGVMRGAALVGSVAIMGPLGIPVTTAVFTAVSGALVERRLAERNGFPSNGTGRLWWLTFTVLCCLIASAASGYVSASSWVSWAIAMVCATCVVVVTAVGVMPELRASIMARWRSRLGGVPRA